MVGHEEETTRLHSLYENEKKKNIDTPGCGHPGWE